jgi:3-isopropylmalate/(R)-2-methylmalate dehydratase large subunit
MAVEAGARGALIAPDAVSMAYVLQRAPDITGAVKAAALADWAQLHTDEGAHFDAELCFDAAEVEPSVTWGTSPDQMVGISQPVPRPESLPDPATQAAARRAIDYTGVAPGEPLVGLAVQRVFIGSCTNARIEDLRVVADLVRGRQVAPGVRAMVVPGSGAVRRQAEAEGVADVLMAAGFEWRQPGCSMCLAMNDDVLAPGERCASTTNRNFEGRQGRASRTHLMSPAMAAAAALAGRIVDVRHF